MIYVFTGLRFRRHILLVFDWRTADTSRIPNCQKFPLKQKADPFQLSTFQFIFLPHTVSCPPPHCHSAVRLTVLFELLIPVVMTSSGTWRRCLQCSGCLVKDFATSCETIKSGDRAWCRLSSSFFFFKSSGGRIAWRKKPSRRDEKDSKLWGEALSLGAMMGWDGEQKVSLIASSL